MYNNQGYGENRPSAKPIIIYPEAHPSEARARSRPGARFRRMNLISVWRAQRRTVSRIPHLVSRISYPASRITYPASRIPYPASRIPHPASRIPHPVSRIPYPASRIPHPASRIANVPEKRTSYFLTAPNWFLESFRPMRARLEWYLAITCWLCQVLHNESQVGSYSWRKARCLNPSTADNHRSR